ncbi:CalY family protein [Natroniella sulfidigena]|uniref:CalY family protein n=1 Tax=Natroniella sulfidigena TaxID=723921 RepID=UPI00200A982B|nr:CalY family protein [Natroniella sulfidigena]MCK8817067.1 CalY family protein [Natroniella sulfidigena]
MKKKLFNALNKSKDNRAEAGKVDLLVSEEEIIDVKNMLPGDTVEGMLVVENIGTVVANYFISAEWFSPQDKPPQEVALIAESLKMDLKVVEEKEDKEELKEKIFVGPLLELINQSEEGVLIEVDEKQKIRVRVTLDKRANRFIQQLDLEVELLFIAVKAND